MNRPKLIAIITGLISIVICLIYLFLITLFDFRSIFNQYLINSSENMAVIFSSMKNFYLF